MGTQLSLCSPGRTWQPHKRGVILIVDDADDLRDLLCAVLTDEHPEHFVLAASSGLDALAMVGKWGRPCLLLLDYELDSHMNGIDLYDALHADPSADRISTIMLSGRLPTAALQQRGIPGMDKPFELDLLLETIASVLVRQANTVTHEG